MVAASKKKKKEKKMVARIRTALAELIYIQASGI